MRTAPFEDHFHAALHIAGDDAVTWSLGGGFWAAATVSDFDYVQLQLGLPQLP